MAAIEYASVSEVVPGSGLARLCGKRGFLTADAAKDAPGKVRLDRREWPVVEMSGLALKAGTRIEVVAVRSDGTLVAKKANPGG
jgi:membrane protein implicated in regulation of membrane protease activity